MTEMPRAPVEGDIPRVVKLMSDHWPEPMDEETLKLEWSSPRIVLELDARLEREAYALVESLDGDKVWIDLRGRPSAALLEWAEARAREKGQRLFAGGWSSNEPLLHDLERRGFGLVRHSHRMEIDLSTPTPEPVWPEGLDVRTFRDGDERVFYDLHQETFVDSWEPIDEPYAEWEHWLLSPPAFVPDLWFLARAGDAPAGIAICHPHPGRPALGWVRILGVRRPWRKRGVGRALLLHAFAEFRQRGLRRAGLGVDAKSLTGANRLYESAGMHVAARFDIYEKMVS